MSNQINEKDINVEPNNTINLTKNKGVVTMENQKNNVNDIDQEEAIINIGKYKLSDYVKHALTTMFVVLPVTKYSQYYIAWGVGGFILHDPERQIVAKQHTGYVLTDGTIVNNIKVTFEIITSLLLHIIKHKKFHPLVFAVSKEVAIKYFTALKAINAGKDPISALTTIHGEQYQELIEPAKLFIEAISKYCLVSGYSVYIDNYNSY